MAGVTFATFQYTSDAGATYPVRLSEKSSGVANNGVSGTYSDGNVKVSVSHHGQKRRTGIQARGYVIGLPGVGDAPYSAKTFLPIISKTVYDAALKGGNVTYDGGTWVILDKVAEV